MRLIKTRSRSVMGKKEITRFIELANVAGMTRIEWPEPRVRSEYKIALEKAAQLLKGTPLYVAGNPEETASRHHDYKALHKTLLDIARAVRKSPATVMIEPPYPLVQKAHINASGQITIGPAFPGAEFYYRTLNVLRETDANRIRECPVCGRLYWAYRKDKQTCLPACRTKKWCTENPERWEKIQLKHDAKRAKKDARSRSRR
jgi:hypothetical protein